MKKTILILMCCICGYVAQAQVYFGGNIGFWRDSDDDVTTLSILPEVGFRFNPTWSIGTSIGYEYQKSDGYTANSFIFAPYARCVFVRTGFVNVFIDGVARIKSSRVDDYGTYSMWRAGVRPGISLSMGPNVSFVATIGFFGYEGNSGNFHRMGFTSSSGLRASVDNISVGICYGF